MTRVVVGYFTKDKILKNQLTDICFASTFNPESVAPTEIQYVQYLAPLRVPHDRAVEWVKFLKTLWHFKTMLSSQKAKSVVDNGAFIDVDKHDVWEIFGLFTALRVIEEGSAIINAWYNYKKFISPFHAFYLAHKYSITGQYLWNTHHMLLTLGLGMPIEELTPTIIAKQFPQQKYETFRTFTYYRKTQSLHSSFDPPKYSAAFRWKPYGTFEEAITAAFPKSYERILDRAKNCQTTAKPTLAAFAVQ